MSILKKLEDKSKTIGETIGVQTGFRALDKILNKMGNGNLVVIGSRPEMGKTSLALNVAYNVCLDTKRPVLYFATEMTSEALTLNILGIVAKVESKLIRKKNLNENDIKAIAKAVAKISELPLYLDDTCSIDIEHIVFQCRKIKEDEGVSLVILDYLQLIKGYDQLERGQQIDKIMVKLASLAQELNCPIVILSQLDREIENRFNKRPQLCDLLYSFQIEQNANTVLFIYRDEVYNRDTDTPSIAEIIIAKNRGGETGRAKLKWVKGYGGFENLE